MVSRSWQPCSGLSTFGLSHIQHFAPVTRGRWEQLFRRNTRSPSCKSSPGPKIPSLIVLPRLTTMTIQLLKCWVPVLGFLTVLHIGGVAAAAAAANDLTNFSNYPTCLKAMRQEATGCFGKSGIDVDKLMNELPPREGENMESTIRQALDIACGVKEELKGAIDCLMSHVIKCVPAQFRNMVPKAEALGKAMDNLCENKDDINFKCLTSMDLGTSFSTCAQTEMKNLMEERGQQNMQDMYCIVFEMIPKCLKHTIKSCGCMTNKVANELFYETLYPDHCPAKNQRRVVCTSDGQKYKFDSFGNGCRHPTACMWVPLLVSAFTVIVSRLS